MSLPNLALNTWRATRGATEGLQKKPCVGCGEVFLPQRWNQTRCKPNCGKNHGPVDLRTTQAKHIARTKERESPRPVLAIDGEGVTDPLTGRHDYVLLSCGDKHLSLDGAHLKIEEVFEFLWQCFQEADPRAIFCGFYLAYDWGQWLRTLPEERARLLLSKDGISHRTDVARERIRRGQEHALAAGKIEKVSVPKHVIPVPVDYLGKWQFDYLPGKRFKLRQIPPKGSKSEDHPWMWICDAGGYYQSSFLKAIDPRGALNPVCSLDEFKLIEEGKARRQSAEYDPAMVKYNQLECEILARLMMQVQAGAVSAGLRLQKKDWFGPGNLAQKWLIKIKASEGATLRAAVPLTVTEAARASYCGGWFEQFHHGHLPGTCYSHDINSAYPFIMSKLPCLLHGTWRGGKERKGGRRLHRAELRALAQSPELGYLYCHLKGDHPIVGAMLHRLPDGKMLRPRETRGWFEARELGAAYRAGFVDEVRIEEGWVFEAGCDCPPPLGPIAELYAERLRVGKNTMAGKAYKLIYNSGYGKYCQSIGMPRFGNAIVASQITAGVRTMILDAIRTHPNGARDLIMVATDSVTFRTPHPDLDIDTARLGAWDITEHKNLTLFLPGLYWDDASRARIAAGEAPIFKSRGISARDLAPKIDEIDQKFDQKRGFRWPQIELPVSFHLISPKMALARGKWALCGTIDQKATRKLNADPKDKRTATRPGPSAPYDIVFDRNNQPAPLSTPYDGRFGDELRTAQEEEFGDHPDGPPRELLQELIMQGD
jgi:hypothetical protein